MKEEIRIKKENASIGLPVTIRCRKNNDEWYVGLKNKDAISTYIEGEGVEEYKIIE